MYIKFINNVFMFVYGVQYIRPRVYKPQLFINVYKHINTYKHNNFN